MDQASREVATRFDFKGTGSRIELSEKSIELATESDQRLKALTQVLEEKLVKRKVSLKLLSYGAVEEASKGTVRQTVSLNVGISDEKAREIGKYIKGLTLKGVQHQVQGDQLRVSGKKRDDLQKVIGGAEGARTSASPSSSPTSATDARSAELSRGRSRVRPLPQRARAALARALVSVVSAGLASRGGGRCALRSAGGSRRGWRS